MFLWRGLFYPTIIYHEISFQGVRPSGSPTIHRGFFVFFWLLLRWLASSLAFGYVAFFALQFRLSKDLPYARQTSRHIAMVWFLRVVLPHNWPIIPRWKLMTFTTVPTTWSKQYSWALLKTVGDLKQAAKRIAAKMWVLQKLPFQFPSESLKTTPCISSMSLVPSLSSCNTSIPVR